MTSNRRLSTRAAYRDHATVVLPGGATREVQMWDIGVDGASLLSPRPIPQGSVIELRLALPGAAGSTPIAVRARVVYSSYAGPAQFRIGTTFLALDPTSADAIAAYAAP